MKYWNWKELRDSSGFKSFKKDYIKIFENHHPKLLNEKKGYGLPRIYKTDKHEEESILNYINTNVSAYTIIVNETLKMMDFNPLSPEGYNLMMDYVLNNKDYWLEILPIITEKIKYTSERGEKKEKLVVDKLNEHFNKTGKFKITSYGGLGNLTDMRTGVDMIISDNQGKDFKAQVKNCTSIILEDNIYKIKYSGVNKLYKGIHYFIFVCDDIIYIFDNDKIVKNYDGYESPIDGLKRKI